MLQGIMSKMSYKSWGNFTEIKIKGNIYTNINFD
jgi:hypothetical protein